MGLKVDLLLSICVYQRSSAVNIRLQFWFFCGCMGLREAPQNYLKLFINQSDLLLAPEVK